MSIKDIALFKNDGFVPIRSKTRFKDKNNNPIYIGDWIHVQEYGDDDERRFGAYDYIGRVEWDTNWVGKPIVVVVYYDIGERDGNPLPMFPKKFREILTEEEIERL